MRIVYLHAKQIIRFFILLFSFLVFSGCVEPSIPIKSGGQFEENYRGAKALDIKQSNDAIQCDSQIVTQIFPNDNMDYENIVYKEFVEGSLEVGQSIFLTKTKLLNAQKEIEYFAKQIGACKVYWTVVERVSGTKSEYMYAVSYFLKVNRNNVIGILPALPSEKIMQDMDRRYGVYVAAVMPDTFADKIGIEEKDVILFINHNRCTYENYVRNVCDVKGTWSIVRLYRNGNIIELK